MVKVDMGPISPFFIVSDAIAATKFYRDKLGFEVILLEPDPDPFFAVVKRGSVQILLKAVAPGVVAVPNHTRHEWAPWDAFIFVSDPLVLAQEFSERKTPLHRAVQVRDDGLHGLEVEDEDGYILFFGRPVDSIE